jgi:ribonuclease HII
MPDFSYERKAGVGEGRIVVGIDEAGRGPLAGPVVAAAVLLDFRKFPRSLRTKVDDSKKLTPEMREHLFDRLQNHAQIGVGMASCIEIDRINILRASLLAMRRALDALGLLPDHALVDGTVRPDLPCSSTLIIEGDGKSFSVAAASIIAKVVRDRLMRAMAGYHPEYGWDHNAGYSTPEHLGALARFGPCLQHRRSFRSVREHLLVRA